MIETVEPITIEIDMDKLVGFREVVVLAEDAEALAVALDDIHNKIGEVSF